MSGKGDTYRPVDSERYGRNYDDIKWQRPMRARKDLSVPSDDTLSSAGVGNMFARVRQEHGLPEHRVTSEKQAET